MIIGVPKEIKDKENRVALTPDGAKQLFDNGHKVFVERNAGLGSGFKDEEYVKSGAKIVDTSEAWGCDTVVKVKEPLEAEYKFMKEGQIIYTYLHLAGVEGWIDVDQVEGAAGKGPNDLQIVPTEDIQQRAALGPQVGGFSLGVGYAY